VESSAKIFAPSSFTVRFDEVEWTYAQMDSGGTPTLGLQFTSEYEIQMRNRAGLPARTESPAGQAASESVSPQTTFPSGAPPFGPFEQSVLAASTAQTLRQIVNTATRIVLRLGG
jgi:hypothetical protein